jgi:hypothetical protein
MNPGVFDLIDAGEFEALCVSQCRPTKDIRLSGLDQDRLGKRRGISGSANAR